MLPWSGRQKVLRKLFVSSIKNDRFYLMCRQPNLHELARKFDARNSRKKLAQISWLCVTTIMNDRQKLTGIVRNILQSTRKYIPSLFRWTFMCLTGFAGPYLDTHTHKQPVQFRITHHLKPYLNIPDAYIWCTICNGNKMLMLTGSSRAKRWFNTGRNSKKVTISRSLTKVYYIC